MTSIQLFDTACANLQTHQHSIDDVRRRLTVFREQITQQEHRAADLARAAFHVEELKRMRQDVLAACATGDSAES